MAKYILRSSYGGIDWHDCNTRVLQIKNENGTFDFQDNEIQDGIVKDILKTFPYLDKETLIHVIENKEILKSQMKEDNGNGWEPYGEVFSDKEKIYYENEFNIDATGEFICIHEDYAFGQVSYTTYYFVSEIEDKDLCYVVQENFLCPRKGTPVVDRIYHPVYKDLKEATNAFEKLQLHENCKSEKTLVVANYNEITITDCYKLNMKAMELMKEKNASLYDDTFSLFVNSHIENLEAI